MTNEQNSTTCHPRAFIFDMDGTLVDNMAYHSKAWLALFEGLGIHLDAEEFLRSTAGKTNPEILRMIIGYPLSEQEVQELSNQKEAHYRELYHPHLKAANGLLPFLLQAKDLGIPMAVATAAGKENIQFILRGLEIECYFKAVIGAEDILKGKPDPEIFLKSAQKLHTDPQACIIFEDSPNGVEAARRAGMKAILVTTSHQPEELGHQPALLLAISDFTVVDIQAVL